MSANRQSPALDPSPPDMVVCHTCVAARWLRIAQCRRPGRHPARGLPGLWSAATQGPPSRPLRPVQPPTEKGQSHLYGSVTSKSVSHTQMGQSHPNGTPIESVPPNAMLTVIEVSPHCSRQLYKLYLRPDTQNMECGRWHSSVLVKGMRQHCTPVRSNPKNEP